MSILDLDEALTSPGEATREFYRQQGRKQEQERIIAALEPHTVCDGACDGSGCVTYGFAESIAIIKGERE